jgi:predicted peptidase
MGGYGTWQLACDNPDRFAAVAPICGYGLASKGFPDRVCALKDVPVWAFHGARDDVVPVADSIVLVDRLRACGGDVRFTVYPDLAHNSWTRTYANPELYTWLLGHSRNGPPPS